MNIIIFKYLNSSLLRLVFILFISLISNYNIAAQTNEDLALFSDLYKVHEHKSNYKKYFKNSSNELEAISTGLFVFYKDFFSSQDGNHCVFYPSCSVYTIEAIKKQGLVLGLMNGIDRLSRCNKLSPENYPLYKNTNLLYDPVE